MIETLTPLPTNVIAEPPDATAPYPAETATAQEGAAAPSEILEGTITSGGICAFMCRRTIGNACVAPSVCYPAGTCKYPN